MRRVALLLLLTLLVPAAVRAAPVEVRSGEHAGFSRLVLMFDAGADWQLGRTAAGYELRTGRSDAEFELSGIWRRIPRDRISAVEMSRPGGLRIVLGCDCHADAFELRGGVLVIDIKDGPPPPGAAFEAPLAEAAGPAADPAPASAAAASPPGPAAEPPSLPDPQRMVGLGQPDLPPPDFSAATAAGSERARAFQQQVLEELARAGAQDLIVPAERGSLPELVEEPPPADASPPPAAAPAESERRRIEDAGHVRIETAVDRDQPKHGGSLSDAGGACPDSSRLDLAQWGHLPGGRPDIAARRDALSGEFDRVDAERTFDLARYYAFLTFGAEALEQLRDVPAEAPDRALVEGIAVLMDRDAPAPGPEVFEGLESCDTAAALWAVLAGPGLRPGEAVDEAAVLRAFDALPDHVKRHLGPALVERLLGAGRAEAAEILRNRLNLAGPGAEIEVAVANALVDGQAGDAEAAAAGLSAALGSEDPDSPEALVALAEARLSAGQAVDLPLLTALQALRQERRGTDLAGRLDRAIAAAELSRDQWRAARDLAVGEVAESDAAAARALLRRIYLDAAAEAPPLDLLRLVLPQPAGLDFAAEDVPARLALGRRIAEFGFPDDALALLGPLAEGPAEGRLIAGLAHLSRGRPQDAIAALSAVDPDLAALPLARAQEALGRFDLALAYYDRAGAAEDAARMALLLQDWAGLAGRSDAALGALATRLAPAAPDRAAPDDAGPDRAAPESAGPDAAAPAAAAPDGTDPEATGDVAALRPAEAAIGASAADRAAIEAVLAGF